MDVEKTAEKIKLHQDRIFNIKVNKIKIIFRSIVVAFLIIIIVIYILFFVVLFCIPDQNISIFLLSILFMVLMFFLGELFRKFNSLPKLRYIEKVHKELKSLEKLTELTNELIKECFIKHKITISDVDFITLNEHILILITFS